MKKIVMIVLASVVGLCGCSSTKPNPNPTYGPAILQIAVFTTAAAELRTHPLSLPGVEAGNAIICAVANGTNASNATLVKALDQYGQWSVEEELILYGIVGIVNGFVNGNTNVSQNLYLKATCSGLADAIVFASAPTAKSAVRSAQPNYPQLQHH